MHFSPAILILILNICEMNKGWGWGVDKILGEEDEAQRRGNSASLEANERC